MKKMSRYLINTILLLIDDVLVTTIIFDLMNQSGCDSSSKELIVRLGIIMFLFFLIRFEEEIKPKKKKNRTRSCLRTLTYILGIVVLVLYPPYIYFGVAGNAGSAVDVCRWGYICLVILFIIFQTLSALDVKNLRRWTMSRYD